MIPPNPPLDSRRATQILLAGDQNLRTSLSLILRYSNWRLRHAMTCREAIRFANENEIAVVICQPQLPDGDWTTVLTALERLDRSPNLIVTDRLPDEALWAKVLNLGGYDVLAQPFDRNEVFRVISSAWRRWDFAWKAAGPTCAAID